MSNAYDPADELAKMSANLNEKTGKSIEDWAVVAKTSGLEKHGEIVRFLKETHGLTHG